MALYEREEALSCLAASFAKCDQGQEQVVIVTGAIGSGKTELIHNFAAKAIAADGVYCEAAASRIEQRLQFGVISQLFFNAALPAEIREQAALLVENGAIAAQASYFEPDATGVGQIPPHMIHGLGNLLLEFTASADRPLLMTVDDAHYADMPSLLCLASVAGRLRRARVMLIISASAGSLPFSPALLAALPPELYCRHIGLDLLTESGVEAMVGERLDATAATRIAPEFYSISGGNPTLVRGLIDDYCRPVTDSAKAQPVVGPHAAQAFLGILHRSDPSLLSFARWLAVLGESVALSVGGGVAGLDRESATRVLDALNDIGVLGSDRFRHPALPAAILAGLAPGEQRAMHARAAEFLRADGAAAPVIARHLLAAEETEQVWAGPVLADAAEQALAAGDVNHALDCLRLAHRAGAGETSRALLARAQWRIDPALTLRHGADVATAIQSGAAAADDAMAWAGRLMWFGRAEEARTALRYASGTAPGLGEAGTGRLSALQAWLCLLFPEPEQSAVPTGISCGPELAPKLTDPMGLAVSLLVNSLTDDTADACETAEQVLQMTPMTEVTVTLLASALLTLLHSGRSETADTLCDSLQKSAADQRAPTWRAVFTALRAMIALRQGNLTAAESCARAALALIPAGSWGIGIAIPLSILIKIASDVGKYKEALTYLRVPVPDSLFKTPLGLYYLHARGRFHYAREDYRSALRDFQSVGDLMAAWQLDVPALIPWRSDAALTQLRLGHGEAAHELATDQLNRLTPRHARERGISLRVLAASTDMSKRPVRLKQAIKELQSCGDRLELAYALADLSQAYQAFGDVGQARRISNRAHHVARQCGTAILTRALIPDTGAGSHDSEDTENHHEAMEPYMELSNAERRVAVLAADGYSNRQIASKLFITVSTVEQHLTRIYSKLKVNGRGDLPFGPYYDAREKVSVLAAEYRAISPSTPGQPAHPPVHASYARAR